MTITIHNRVPREDLALGMVRAEGVCSGEAPAELSDALDRLIAERAGRELDPSEEALRKGSRDMLRNGKYKPTGRGKPASEYLMREAANGRFPRINGPVDANNLVSLKACVPISLWDLDRALRHRGPDRASPVLAPAGGVARQLRATSMRPSRSYPADAIPRRSIDRDPGDGAPASNPEAYEVRLGAQEEQYVFNAGGQLLQLRDLVCGCALTDGQSAALITPIKDGLASKLTPESARLAGCIYYPLPAGSKEHLEQVTQEFAGWLGKCGEGVEVSWGVVLPGASGVV